MTTLAKDMDAATTHTWQASDGQTWPVVLPGVKIPVGTVVLARLSGVEEPVTIKGAPELHDGVYWYPVVETNNRVAEFELVTPVLLTWDMLHYDGAVIELRALLKEAGKASAVWEGWGNTVFGYFDNYEAFFKVVRALNKCGKAKSIYATLNPVDPALKARAYNRLKAGKDGECASDTDIMRRRWLLIDADPIRPEGISSTDEELQAAIECIEVIERHLHLQGWPEPVRTLSGNGAHRLYPISLLNDEPSKLLLEHVLKSLQLQYGDTDKPDKELGAKLTPGAIGVKIDTSVYNAARIDKLYGTMACKGDDIPERPHRPSYIESMPSELRAVPIHLLKTQATVYEDYKDNAEQEQSEKREQERARRTGTSNEYDDVIADFNAGGKIEDDLKDYGYTHIRGNRWSRPGKEDSGGLLVDSTAQKAYAFSDNDAMRSGHRFDRFDLFCEYKHGGDRTAAYIEAKKAQGKWTEETKRTATDPKTGKVIELTKTPAGSQIGNLPQPAQPQANGNHVADFQEMAREATIPPEDHTEPPQSEQPDVWTPAKVCAYIESVAGYEGHAKQIALDSLRGMVAYLDDTQRKDVFGALLQHRIFDKGRDAQAFVDTCPQPPGADRFTPYTLDELLARPDKVWLIDQIIGAGDSCMIYGQPGSKKNLCCH